MNYIFTEKKFITHMQLLDEKGMQEEEKRIRGGYA